MAVMQSIVFASAVILVLLVNEGENSLVLTAQKFVWQKMKMKLKRMISGANNF